MIRHRRSSAPRNSLLSLAAHRHVWADRRASIVDISAEIPKIRDTTMQTMLET
jgi:hypothetical protein